MYIVKFTFRVKKKKMSIEQGGRSPILCFGLIPPSMTFTLEMTIEDT